MPQVYWIIPRRPVLRLLTLLVVAVALAGAAGAEEGSVVPQVYGGTPRATSLAPRTWVRVLENRGFTIGYSEWRRNPLWVAYHARPVPRRRPYRRPESFEVDRRTLARVAPQDYTRSGYQRGHLAPSWLIAQLHGRQAQRQTFLMSNITPQRPRLNQKLWQRLEEVESNHLAPRLDGVWVLTGPVFDSRIERLRSGVEVPDAFYRILVAENVPGRPELLAFLVPQEVRGDEPLHRFLTTVDEIESRTGLDFLPALEDGLEQRLESAPADPGHWRLAEICCLPARY